MSDFFEVIRTRRSIRAFAPLPVEEEKLQSVLTAANQAPSAGNLQAYEIYVARKSSDRRALAAAALNQDFLAGAPVALVFCAHPARAAHRYGERGKRLYAVQDATVACTFAMLAAEALGLGSVWIGAFEDEKVLRAIGNPAGVIPVAILPVGYNAEKPLATPRRPLADLVHEL
jgi:nitroreductase